MAVIKISGLEAGDVIGEKFTFFGPAGDTSIQTVTKRTGVYALRVKTSASNGSMKYAFSPGPDEVFLRFYFRVAAFPASGTNPICVFSFLNANRGFLSLRSDKKIDVYDAAVNLVGTSTSALVADTWYRIELRWKKGTTSTSTDGIMELKIAGTVEVSSTTAVTKSDTLSNQDLGNGTTTNTTYDVYYDDIFMDNATYPGVGQCEMLTVNNTGNLAQFDTRVGSATPWQNVDEIPLSETDYNQHANTTDATDLYAVIDSAATSIKAADTINLVQGHWRMKRGAGTGTHQISIRENAVQTDTTVTLDTVYDTFFKIWTTPPNSGGSWTTSKLDSLEIGARHLVGGGSDTFLAWCAFSVDYTPSATSARLEAAKVIRAW